MDLGIINNVAKGPAIDGVRMSEDVSGEVNPVFYLKKLTELSGDDLDHSAFTVKQLDFHYAICRRPFLILKVVILSVIHESTVNR